MLISVILLSLLDSYLTFDFPIPFERPEVAFQSKRLSKYYDVATSTWRDSELSLKQTYSQMLSFCQKMYPDRDIVRLHQGSPKTLQFCKVKDNSKCGDFDIVTWICVSRDEFNTEQQTASPASTASRPVTGHCLNETIEHVQYEHCTSIEIAIYSCSENTTFSKMDNVRTCNVTTARRRTSGLLSADLRCCAKEESAHTTDSLPQQEGQQRDNPFNPFWTETNPTVNPTDPDLIPEWCGLEQVEARRGNITDAKMEIMKEIYTQNEDSEGEINYDELVAQIEKVERDLNKEVVALYKDHFACLADTVRQLALSALALTARVTAPRTRDSLVEEIQAVNSSLLQVSVKFAEICANLVEGESNDFNKDYREVVTELQILRGKVEKIKYNIENWEEQNCAHCPPTTQQHDHNTLPPVRVADKGGSVDPEQRKEEDEEDEDNSKLKNQKYLIAVVSTVSVITIIVALVFFIVVVRRTLHKDVAGRFTSLPAADILTNEQYVAFLQKNGYANPTCRLPQKYLDDHD